MLPLHGNRSSIDGALRTTLLTVVVGAYPMRSNVENDAGEGSVSAFDDGYVLHGRPEARRRHVVVVVVVVLAVDSCADYTCDMFELMDVINFSLRVAYRCI